jgi:hypothetical protein
MLHRRHSFIRLRRRNAATCSSQLCNEGGYRLFGLVDCILHAVTLRAAAWKVRKVCAPPTFSAKNEHHDMMSVHLARICLGLTIPYRDAAARERLFEGFRMTGLPE